MAWGDSFYRKASAKIERQIGEPVEVIGWASRTGAMNAVISSQVLRASEVALGGPDVSGVGIPGDRLQTADGGKGVRLPMNFMVALTPTALRVFKVRKGWTGLKIKKELGALPRDGLRLAIADAKVTKQFSLASADGSAIRFEMTRSKFATKFAEELQAALDGAPHV